MKGDWTKVIKPKKGLWDVDLKSVWNYRDLLMMYVKRDVVVVYKQTILGPLWFLIQPVFTTIMYMFVFGGLAGISTDGIPHAVFYLAGILLWNYFTACFDASSNVFLNNQNVFGKVYFPRLVVPLSGLISNLLKLLIQLLLFVVVYLYYVCNGADLNVTPVVLLFPYLVLLIAIFSMSWGLLVSSWTTKYRDLKLLVQFGIQLFMYATPVVYPLSSAEGVYKTVLLMNPLSSIFECFRFGVSGVGCFEFEMLIYPTLSALFFLLLSVVVFSKTERSFMDTI